MTTTEKKWGRFIGYAAQVHELLTDAQRTMSEAALLPSITPDIVDQLSVLWWNLSTEFQVFLILSSAIETTTDLTPEEITMATFTIRKINEAARETDASLRLFFQKTGLASMLPSREESNEGLQSH